MSTDNERGALGERFHDLPTPADAPGLSWEEMAPNALPAKPEQKPRVRISTWWWFAVAVFALIIGAGGYAFVQQDTLPIVPVVEEVTAPKADSPQQATAKMAVKEVLPSTSSSINQMTEGPGKTKLTEVMAAKIQQNNLPSADATEQTAEFPPQPYRPQQLPTNIPQVESPVPAVFSGQVDQLPTQSITEIVVPKRNVDSKVLPEEHLNKVAKTKTLSLMAGPLSYDLGYNDPTATSTPQLSAQLRLGYEQALNDRWFVSTGLEVRHYRFQSAFEDVDNNARIYQPGTVDTIFRNITTGEETVSITDTVGGTRIRRFINDNVVNTVGLPLMLGYNRAFTNHRFSFAAGPRVDFLLNREGKVVINDLEIIEFSESSGFGKSIRWSGRLEAGYDWQPKGRWSLSLRFGAEATLSDWSTNGLGQRPNSFDGMIGLRYRL